MRAAGIEKKKSKIDRNQEENVDATKRQERRRDERARGKR